jgi:hypothetical protein
MMEFCCHSVCGRIFSHLQVNFLEGNHMTTLNSEGYNNKQAYSNGTGNFVARRRSKKDLESICKI